MQDARSSFTPQDAKLHTHTKTILKGWQDQHNKLWQVQIVEDGWTSNLKIKDDTHQIPLTTPPTGLITILPSAPTGISATISLAMTTVPLIVSFFLPSNHADKYSKAYRLLEPKSVQHYLDQDVINN